MPDYPNREHKNADEAARRRALTSLRALIEDAETLIRRIESGGYEPHGEDGTRFTSQAVKLTANLAYLEQLRDVREWHAADAAG